MSSLLGAAVGFLCVTWPLLCVPSEEAAPWAQKPTAISGLGSLLLAWLGALAGARLSIALTDAGASLLGGTLARPRPPVVPSVCPTAQADAGAARRHDDGRPLALSVPLASNGARPRMAACITAFAGHAAADAHGGAGVPHMLVAAGGPEVLLTSLAQELRPWRVRLTRLTHPM